MFSIGRNEINRTLAVRKRRKIKDQVSDLYEEEVIPRGRTDLGDVIDVR